MSTWQENLAEFDREFIPLQQTGSAEGDGNFNAIIRQLTAFRKTAEAGFMRMEDIITKLGVFDNDLKGDLFALKKEMLTTVDPGIALGAKMDIVNAKIASMGNITEASVKERITGIEQRILQNEDNNKNKFSTIDKILDKHSTGLQNIVSDGGGTSTNIGSKRSLLECKAIQSLKIFDGDRATYKEYLHKFKNNLFDVAKDPALKFWFEVAERCLKNPSAVFDSGAEYEEYETYKDDYDRVGDVLTTIFTDKFGEKTEAYKITKRRKRNGVLAFAELNRHYIELTGMGIRDLTNKINNPDPIKKEEDILAAVADWEDLYDEGIKMGMTEIPDMHKIAILEDMLPEGPYSMRERLEKQYHTDYIKAREELLKWARDKFKRFSERTKTKRSILGEGKHTKNPNDMEVDAGGANAFEQASESQSDYDKGYEAGAIEAFGKSGTKGYEKGAYGQPYNKGGYGGGHYSKGQYGPAWPGKGQGPAGYGATPYNDNPKGLGKKGQYPRPGYPFYGNCKGCGEYGHKGADCPAQGKGFKGKCNICWVAGHVAAECPKGKGKGKGKGGLNEFGEGYDEYTDNSKTEGAETENEAAGGFKSLRFATPLPSVPPGLKKDSEKHECPQNCDCGQWKTRKGKRYMILSGGTAGGLYQLTKEDHTKFMNAPEDSGDYEKVTAIIDSGSVTTVMPIKQCEHLPIVETETSKSGVFYTDASGNKIYNQGQRNVEAFSTEGVPLEFPWQVAKVSRPLISVRETKAAHNATIFGLDEDHAVINRKTGKVVMLGGQDAVLDQKSGRYLITKIIDTGKDFVIDLYVPKQNNSIDQTLPKGAKFGNGGDELLSKCRQVAPFLRHP